MFLYVNADCRVNPYMEITGQLSSWLFGLFLFMFTFVSLSVSLAYLVLYALGLMYLSEALECLFHFLYASLLPILRHCRHWLLALRCIT